MEYVIMFVVGAVLGFSSDWKVQGIAYLAAILTGIAIAK
jgi:hypothetical protein